MIKLFTIMILKYLTITRRISLVITIMAITSVACSQKGVIIDEIIAKVDNHIVLKSELEFAYLDLLTRGQLSGPNSKCQVLENIIVSKLLLAKAEIDSVIVVDAEVEASLNNKMQYFISQIGSEEKLEEYYGKSIEQFKEELKEREKEQMIIQRMQGTITNDINITPAKVKKFFSEIPRDSLPYFSKEVSLGQLTKTPVAGNKIKNEVKARLLKIKQRLENGEDFNTLARENSEPITARTGGELGWMRRGSLVAEFEATALSLEVNEISNPVETQFGIHLIQLLEVRGNEFNSRHILIPIIPTKEDIQKTMDELDSIRNLILLDSITFEKAAKDLSDDQITAANGGFLIDDETGAPLISVEKLDPTTFFTIDTMQVGNISKASVFKTEAGGNSVRILYFKEFVKPHQANLDQDYQKIRQAALNAKKSKILNDWFNKARFDVFINIDDEYSNCNILN